MLGPQKAAEVATLAHTTEEVTASPSYAPPTAGGTTGGWTTKGFVLSLAPEVSEVVAAALGVSVDGADEFSALRSLSDETIAARLTEAGLSGLIPVITKNVGKLREQQQPDEQEQQEQQEEQQEEQEEQEQEQEQEAFNATD